MSPPGNVAGWLAVVFATLIATVLLGPLFGVLLVNIDKLLNMGWEPLSPKIATVGGYATVAVLAFGSAWLHAVRVGYLSVNRVRRESDLGEPSEALRKLGHFKVCRETPGRCVCRPNRNPGVEPK